MLRTALSREGQRALTVCALVAGVFILTHPYLGVRHDNVLYLAQAFHRLYPEVFAGDVFFRFGSQDQFSVFSSIYALLIERFGVGHTGVALIIVAQAGFLLASYGLVRELFTPILRGWSLVFVACSGGFYGGLWLLRIAESFVTPRPFAEALTLCAIVLVVRGRAWGAFGVLAATALLHPLMAFCGMLFWWAYLVLEDRRWLALAVVGLVPVLAGWLGMAPFSMLFQRFDAEWLAILLEQNWHLFPLHWERPDLSLVIVDVLVLTLVIRMETGRLRMLACAALWVGLGGTALAIVGADLLENVLLTSLQTWRALWITHWFAAAATPVVALRLWREPGAGPLLAGLVVFGFLMRGSDAALASSALLTIMVFSGAGRSAVKPRLLHAALAALAVGVCVKTGVTLMLEWKIADALMLEPYTQLVLRVVSKPAVLLVFAAGIYWLLKLEVKSWIATPVAVGVFAASAMYWDQRSNLLRYADWMTPGTHPFAAFVKPNQQVYWHHQSVAPWLFMKRMNYFSKMQTAGQVFSRGAAMELKRRADVLAPLEFQERLCAMLNELNRTQDSCEPDLVLVREVCEQAGDLDFIVLTTRLESAPLASWTPPVDTRGTQPLNYLYECRALLGK